MQRGHGSVADFDREIAAGDVSVDVRRSGAGDERNRTGTRIGQERKRHPRITAHVAHHRERRPAHWGLREEPLELAALLAREASPQRCLLVDCLTLWLSNLLFAGDAACQAEAGEAVHCPLLQGRTQALVELLPTLPGHIILVSNEVGWGIVPMHPVSRLFGDEQGRLNQRVGAACEQVTLVAAGLPLSLKAPAGSAA